MSRALCRPRAARARALSASIVFLWAAAAAAAPWSQEAKLTADDAAGEDFFGCSVSLDGTRALIGARGMERYAGGAYAFQETAAGWTQTAKLRGFCGPSEHGGSSVSLDGATALVGAVEDDQGGSDGAGAAFIFQDSGGSWSRVATLTGSDATTRDAHFGISVSLDGTTALVGAFGVPTAGKRNSGAAYIFEDTGSRWTETARFAASDAAAGDLFGGSVSLSGTTALVGASGDDDGGERSGAAYIFQDDGTGAWSQVAKLTASDATGYEQFGRAVSLSGTTALVGAPEDDHAGRSSGSAYIFQESGGTWSQVAKLTAADAAIDDFFGRAVALSGTTALVGAGGDDDAGSASGSAYLFQDDGTGAWNQVAKLTANDAAAGDHLGRSFWGGAVALDGTTALVGASGNDDAGADSGSAYVFSEGSDLPPTADADGPYAFSGGQTTLALDGSGSTDDNGISVYDWDVDGGTITLSGMLPTLHIQDSGLAGQSDVVDVLLTVTDTASQTDADTTSISYTPFPATILSCSATVEDDLAKFDFEVQDDDLAINQWIADWQVLSLEIDDEQAASEGDVAEAGAFWFATYSGSTSLVDPQVASGSPTVDIPLWEFPYGQDVTVWLNIAGSHDSMAMTFYNHYPEPTTLTLLTLGGLALWRRRRRTK